MRYEKYNLEDFLSNEEFRNWVIRPTKSSHLFWKKWLEVHPEQREVIESARETILTLKFQKVEKVSNYEREEVLKNVINRHQIKEGQSRKSRTLRLYYGVAASLLLLLGFSFYFFNEYDGTRSDSTAMISQITKENSRGQKTKILLPDGSKVWLNSQSRIEYPNKFLSKRTVLLKGEAFFEVAENPNKPFEVYSNGIITTALGTSFNINAFDKSQVEVGLVTGKISVERGKKNNRQKVFVNPGEKAVYKATNNQIDVQKYSDLDFIKWTNRVIVFKKANLKEIEERLERWYDVNIDIINANRPVTFTGEFKNESLEVVLERLAFIEKFDFKINENNIKIYF